MARRGISTPLYLFILFLLAGSALTATYILFIRSPGSSSEMKFQEMARVDFRQGAESGRTGVKRSLAPAELEKTAPDEPAAPPPFELSPIKKPESETQAEPGLDKTEKTARPGTGPPRKSWALNVFSTQDQAEALRLYQALLESPYKIYTYPTVSDGRTWHRVRVGFFASYEEAKQAGAVLEKKYNLSKPWIVQPSREELAEFSPDVSR